MLEKTKKFVADDMQPGFHDKRSASFERLRLRAAPKRKNPYLFRAKSVNSALEMVKQLLDAHLSSNEETLFGEFPESLATFVCQEVYGGQKSTTEETHGKILTRFTAEFASGNRTFAVVYLGLHGIVKLLLVVALLRKIRPMYPVAVVVLGLFVVYEIYRATRTGSVLLPFLAALDVAIIALVIREYRALTNPAR